MLPQILHLGLLAYVRRFPPPFRTSMARSVAAHLVTSSIDSPMMRPDIFDFPRSRSRNTIGVSTMLLGRSEFAARLPNAIAFLLTVLLLLKLGPDFAPQRPWLPGLIYATAPVTVLGEDGGSFKGRL